MLFEDATIERIKGNDRILKLTKGEQTWEIPAMNRIPAKTLLKFTKGTDEDKLELLLDLFDMVAPGFTETASLYDIENVESKWAELSGMDAGE